MTASGEYGPGGLVGIATPQANPTVEAEMRILLPPTVALAVSRLTSRSADPQERLRHYLGRIEETLLQYDTLALDAFGFGCTASSYLMEQGEEERILAAAESRFCYPLFTACGAIEWQLRRLGARRLALVSPYPQALAEAAAGYWRARGFEVLAADRVETGSSDTRSIYVLTGEVARPAVTRLRRLDVDAVLLSGTGMPTLRLIAEASGTPPLLSSNLCLAMRLCAHLDTKFPLAEDWRARLDLTTGIFKKGTYS